MPIVTIVAFQEAHKVVLLAKSVLRYRRERDFASTKVLARKALFVACIAPAAPASTFVCLLPQVRPRVVVLLAVLLWVRAASRQDVPQKRVVSLPLIPKQRGFVLLKVLALRAIVANHSLRFVVKLALCVNRILSQLQERGCVVNGVSLTPIAPVATIFAVRVYVFQSQQEKKALLVATAHHSLLLFVSKVFYVGESRPQQVPMELARESVKATLIAPLQPIQSAPRATVSAKVHKVNNVAVVQVQVIVARLD